MDDSFGEHTKTIRKWVNRDSVPTRDLAIELLAWYHFALKGLSSTEQSAVLKMAANLHVKIYQE